MRTECINGYIKKNPGSFCPGRNSRQHCGYEPVCAARRIQGRGISFYPPLPAARTGQALALRGLSAPSMRAGSGKPPAVHGAWKSLGSAMQGGGCASSPRLRQPAARSGSAGTGSATHPPPCMACCNVDQSAAPGVRLALPGGAHAGCYVISGRPRLSVSGGSGGQGWMNHALAVIVPALRDLCRCSEPASKSTPKLLRKPVFAVPGLAFGLDRPSRYHLAQNLVRACHLQTDCVCYI